MKPRLHWKQKIARGDEGSRLYAGDNSQILATTFRHDGGWRSIIRLYGEKVEQGNLSGVYNNENEAKQFAERAVATWFKEALE